jgi:hypothetical protein
MKIFSTFNRLGWMGVDVGVRENKNDEHMSSTPHNNTHTHSLQF